MSDLLKRNSVWALKIDLEAKPEVTVDTYEEDMAARLICSQS